MTLLEIACESLGSKFETQKKFLVLLGIGWGRGSPSILLRLFLRKLPQAKKKRAVGQERGGGWTSPSVMEGGRREYLLPSSGDFFVSIKP